MGVARLLTYLLAVGGLAIAVACALALVRGADRGPVYSVATLLGHLAKDPQSWEGRTLVVRGYVIAAPCPEEKPAPRPSCTRSEDYLTDPGSTPTVARLPLVWERQDAVSAFLHGLPLVNEVIGRSQMPRWWMPATYRVQLRVTATGLCGVPPCYEALLLDAGSGGSGR